MITIDIKNLLQVANEELFDSVAWMAVADAMEECGEPMYNFSIGLMRRMAKLVAGPRHLPAPDSYIVTRIKNYLNLGFVKPSVYLTPLVILEKEPGYQDCLYVIYRDKDGALSPLPSVARSVTRLVDVPERELTSQDVVVQYGLHRDHGWSVTLWVHPWSYLINLDQEKP